MMKIDYTYIYSLEFPKGNIKYIGKSNNPEERLKSHIEDSKKSTNSHKLAWVNGLLKEGDTPILNIVDEVNISEWQFWEKFYISLFRSWGFNLTNSTFGGDGISNPSKQVRKKISNTLKEYYVDNEVWNKGKVGISSGWKEGKKQTKEHIEKVRQTRLKKFSTGEIKIWNKGLTGVQEPWNKGKKGVMPTPWNKDLSPTKETISKISESCKKAYQNKKAFVCPHCLKESKNNKFLSYHFDNCKMKGVTA